MYIPQYGDILNNTYQVVDFLRMNHEIYSYKVQHIKTKQFFIIKLLDYKTSPLDVIVMFVNDPPAHSSASAHLSLNEVRLLTSFDHPLVIGFEEVFVDIEEAIIW